MTAELIKNSGVNSGCGAFVLEGVSEGVEHETAVLREVAINIRGLHTCLTQPQNPAWWLRGDRTAIRQVRHSDALPRYPSGARPEREEWRGSRLLKTSLIAIG